jgi:exodeoxyribonuclease VIII
MNAPQTVQPGIYPTMSNKDYHSSPGISKSGLDLIARSPYLFRYRPPITEPTRAMLIGSAAHSATLEPERFGESFVVAPDVDGRSKEGKAALAEFGKNNTRKTVLKLDDFVLVESISKAVRAHPVAKNILSDEGQAEMSIFNLDEHTGELVKARPDWMVEDCLVDLKTTEDASAEAFSRACWNFRYYVQAAFYLDVVNSQYNGRFNNFVFIVVEKSPPFQVAVYYADATMIEVGRMTYQQNLALYSQCKHTDFWPGLGDEKIQPIGLPGWALKNIDMAIAD